MLTKPQQLCVGGVLAKAASLGCAATDGGQPSAECLCSKIDFAYALRDCSTESCPSGTNIQPVNEYGLSYCQSGKRRPLPPVPPPPLMTNPNSFPGRAHRV